MVSKNNVQVKDRYATKQVPHYGIRKLSVGVASVLLGTTFYMGMNGNVVHADTVNGQDSETPDSQVANSDSNSNSNSNSNIESTADRDANAVLGNSQAVVSAAEDAVKNEVNTKPQVTEISTDSHAQSSAVNTASNADAQSQNSQNRADAALGDHQAAASNSSASAESETNAKPQADAASNADAQSQSSQNHTNAGLSDKQPAASAAETAKLNVSDLKQADFGMAAALNTNLTQTSDDTTVVKPSAPITNDSFKGQTLNGNKALVGTGKQASVQMSDGSSLSIDNNVIDPNKSSAILTFKSNSFKAGDSYQIVIDKNHGITLSETDVAKLQPSFGTTVFEETNDQYIITDHFINDGTISQAIKLSYDDAYVTPWSLAKMTANVSVVKNRDSSSIKTLPVTVIVPEIKLKFSTFISTNNGAMVYNHRDVDLKSSLLFTASGFYHSFSDIAKATNTLTVQIAKLPQYFTATSCSIKLGNTSISVPIANGKATFTREQLAKLSYNKYQSTFVIHGRFDVPDNLFTNSKYQIEFTGDDDVTVNLAYQNNYGSLNSSNKFNHITVLDGNAKLTAGDVFGYNQSYSAYFADNDYSKGDISSHTIPVISEGGTVKKNDNNTSGESDSIVYDLENRLTDDLHNVTWRISVPDGLNINMLQQGYLSGTDRYRMIVTLRNGKRLLFNDTDLNNHLEQWREDNIASIDVIIPDFKGGDELQFYLVADLKNFISKTYANGMLTQPGDLMIGSSTVSVDGYGSVTVDNNYIRLVDHSIPDKKGMILRTDSHQTNKTPGVLDCGTMYYSIHSVASISDDVYRPYLKKPVFYIQVPENAVLQDPSNIVVHDANHHSLNPKSISLLTIGEHQFIKVDLSNYNVLSGNSARISVNVPYSNVSDIQSSSKPAPWLVVSDSLTDSEQDNKVFHFDLNSTDNTDTPFKQLVKQEGINPADTAYDIYDRFITWDIVTSDGMTSATMTKGNVASGPSMDSTQNDHKDQADTFNLYGSIIDATDQSISNSVQVINVPTASDGHSQFDPHLSGPIHVIDAVTGKNLDSLARVAYSESAANLSAAAKGIPHDLMPADQVTDWSKIKSIMIFMDVPKRTSARAVLTMKDPQIYDHVGKTIYVASTIFSLDDGSHSAGSRVETHLMLSTADSNANDGLDYTYYLKPITIAAGSAASAKLTVNGQSTVKTMVHYKDSQGDHYVELPDKAKTYNELQDMMNRSDFLQSASDLTDADRILLPAGMVLDYAHPTIKNSNESYLDGYQNGTAAFGQKAKYDFDQDAVVFEGAVPTQVTDTKPVTETIHYVYENGPKAGQKAADDVTESVEFSRVGFKNPFTHEVQWAENTDSKSFDAVDSPQITGYLASQAQIAAQNVTQDSNNIEMTVKYKSQQQKMTVKYIDDDAAGKVLHTDSLTGLSNEIADYTTANEINALTGQHYVLVSDDTKGQKPVYDDDADTDQVFNVHVKHATHSISDSRTVTETVHYQAADGSQVPNDHVAKANFTRTGTHDEVTGTDHWNAWNASSHSFDAVPTPAKTGYTPDVQTVPAETVTPESSNIRKVVTYTPDAQKLSVKFIDDTTGRVLKTVAKTGVTNADAKYNTKSDIDSYEGHHYVLVSDSSNGANLVFDNNDSTDQAYEVHLKHGTHQIDEHHTITQTVHYIATDHASVPDDHIVSVQFDRDGYHDEVMGVDHWNAWKQGSTQTFAEVPTPKKAGYTPDKSSVPATVVHPLDHNQTIDVTYTPDTQKVIITFVDDTDNGKTLKTVTKTGPTNSSAGYTTGDDINTYKGQHYVLVSDQTHGQSITFDADTNADQRYEVHLKHGTHPINDQRTITESVHYKMADGTTAPADHTAKAEFSRDGFNDEVTGDDHWNDWTPSATQQFDAVQSPAVKGYTPDADQVPTLTVNPDSQSIERTVTYTPDVQKLDVTFIDDTAGTTLKTVVKNGVTNADAKYSTKSDIQNFESQHYVLVSDSSKGAGLVFDNDDAADQHYVVHLKHNTHTINEHHVINEIVHYQMSDGTKAPADYQAKALSFSRDGFNDEVTGIDHWNAWTPKAEQTFDKVASPLVAGYTPDIDQINTQTVKPTDHDLEFTVTYTPNVQIAHVKYIDDTDHKVLTQDDLHGRTGETSDYHTADRIAEFKGQHYDLVSDDYPADGITFDNNDRADQNYEVHFKHATRTDEQDVQVPRTIKYVYQNGQQAQPDHSDALKFHETKVVDLVDGHTVSDDWTPAQDFKTIETPVIQGYTPDHASVSNMGIAHDHPAIVETVTYNPDAQKAVVKYIDDTTGEQLEAKDLTGVSDQSTGYSTKDTIDGYVNQHYVLVSDGTHGETITFDHDDNADQAYEVHLKHGTEPANESRIKKIIVHYQYADGQARTGKASDDQTATNLTFKRTGTHDLVTDKIAWDAWDHADQTFASVDSPAIQGYTPDRTVVDNIKVNPDSRDLTEVTVTYNADSQKLSVDFIDDTTGKTLKTVNKIGYSDENAGYNTKSDIQDLISKHYDLTSDQTNGENLVFDHDDNINQHYEVHLSHHTHQINEHHTITETVHYQYADGLARSGKAADDFNAAPLSFSRDGFNDEVTGVDHWNTWTPAAQQNFAVVQSPVIQGYTPDQSEIGAINVVPTSQNIEKTVTYTADGQKLTVNFIDDTTGKTLKTVTKTGYSDGNAGYNTKADIQTFVGQHYDLVSDTTKGADLVFDHNDGADQVYDVHLTHHLTPISDHQVVNETIHYIYADDLARTGKAADDYTAAPLEFNRTGKHDDVTGIDAWNAWTPANHQTFAAVTSPLIQGYTPDQSQIDVILVDANSQDIVKTVTYSANQQKMTVDFIDDTDNGKVLKTVIKTGGSDEAVGYNTKADIQTFVDGHYKLDHDTSNGKNLVFDHDDAVDQHYEVHLTHATAPISEATSTNQVIHYQLADGTPVAKDYTAKVDFSRDGFKDLVTNDDHWNAWTPNATQTFDAVASPVKAGYTPDHAQVDAVTVEPHHANLETTVTYSPDAQNATVKYIDDTTGKTLQTKELTGVSDETSVYTTESTINQYVGQHYKLVSDQTNGKPVVFDHDDGSDQVFEVYLAHTYQNVSQEHQVHQIIHYQFADGKQARPDYTAAVLAFSRTGVQDLVTENIQWNVWTPDQVFAAVDTPAVNGYTPDVQTVAPVKVGHDSKDIEQTVVYHADDQTILVNYIDDDTHSTLKTDSIVGKTAQTSDYTTKKSLDQYKGQHYDVVSDDTNGNTLKFDSDSTKVQTYNVHLKHQHQAASDKATVHQTVHYVYQDGKQAAKDHVATPIEFTRTGDTDLVTGKTTWNPWTPATGTFVAVLSPAIAGYTPSRAMINHVDVHPGDKDLDTTVAYVPDQQVIVVNYIDQTTGKTLKTDTLNGRSDQTSSYATKSQIDSYLGQHYKLISDDTNGQTLTFDHDDQATQTYDVVLGHQTEAAHRTHEVHEIVDYVYADGSQAAKSFTAQPIVFSQTGVHDLVTNTTDWNGEWTKPQVFAAVESPKIVGFTASKPEVKAVEVNHQSSDVHELVIYAANAQTAQIKYIDDVTGSTLETDGASGHFNESIVFSHNVNDQINKFKQAYYKLVSNNFDGQKYQADNTKNVYEVHLIHERQNVHATDSVTETVKFQYSDGSQAQPVKTQTVNFGRDGIKDLVTGTIAWMPVDSQTIAAVDVPAIDGYTADIKSVPAVKVDFGDDDITKVVTYTANDQTAGIKIIDDTTGKVLNTQSAAGKFGTEIQFKQNPDQQVIDLQAQHYELVSDTFKHQKYQSDNAKNQFEIHVKHQMMDTQRTDEVTETVRYQDNHGNMLHPVTTQTKMFTEHGIIDQVTDKTVWTPAKSQTMDAVSAPEITGYTPNKPSVPGTTVNFGDKDINEVIVYTPVSETANIKYIDDTTGKTLLSDQTTGDFGSQIKFDHDPLTQINQYEGQGYKLVSNSYGKTVHQFSAASGENNFEVHFKHGTMPVIDTDTVTETIHYLGPDGNKLAPDNTQTITFTRHGIKDQVTGQIDWNSVEPQEFNAVKSPVINGYQADIAVVEGRQVLFSDQDVVVNVHYTKLSEQQPGKHLGTGMANTGKVTLDTGKHLGTGMANTGKVTPEKVVAVANGTVQETKQNPVKNSAQSTMQDTKRLPQTGNDDRAGLLSLIGSSLMAGLVIFGLNKKKKHEN